MSLSKNPQEKIKRLVVKFGTAILTLKNGRLNEPLIHRWVSFLSDLRDQEMEIIIVTSGAIGAGMGQLNLNERPGNLPDEQAVAAVGQGLLMGIYGQGFRQRGYQVAQILVSRGDLDDRQRHLNVRNCLGRLLAMGIVPIVNENDTVATDELCFGDNDILSAIVASKIQADLLAILTDVDGLYDCDPGKFPEAKVVALVEDVTSEVESMASATTSALGSGGMRSKIIAAQAATRAGIPAVIANGKEPRNLRRLLSGESVGTRFVPPETSRLSERERWIAWGAYSSTRKIIVDDGARTALVTSKKSLLPAGVRSHEGDFEKGDVVEICDPKNRCFARGLTNYSSDEIEKIKGCQSADISAILGENRYDEVVHRDNMVVLAT